VNFFPHLLFPTFFFSQILMVICGFSKIRVSLKVPFYSDQGKLPPRHIFIIIRFFLAYLFIFKPSDESNGRREIFVTFVPRFAPAFLQSRLFLPPFPPGRLARPGIRFPAPSLVPPSEALKKHDGFSVTSFCFFYVLGEQCMGSPRSLPSSLLIAC